MTIFEYLLLFILASGCGVINVLAGGGSNIILPVLMMFGVPPDIANGSNRVGIFLQAVTGASNFYQKKRLPTDDLKGILHPILLGGLVGVSGASFIPVQYLKPLLLGTMLALTTIMLFVPSIIAENEIPKRVSESKSAFWWLFGAAMYGGFVQAGVGFILIMALSGCLRYDLVATNALKLLCTIFFTAVALGVFIWRQQIDWTIGLILAAGNSLGAYYGVRLAINIAPKNLKKILFAMTLFAVTGAFLK